MSDRCYVCGAPVTITPAVTNGLQGAELVRGADKIEYSGASGLLERKAVAFELPTREEFAAMFRIVGRTDDSETSTTHDWRLFASFVTRIASAMRSHQKEGGK